MLASTPRKATGPTDITGGLPRVTELFEARPPKDPAVMAEIDGEVKFGDRKRGKRTIIVVGESGTEVEHIIPQGKHFRVHSGDRVKAGEPLVDGTLVPKDLLRICGEEALQDYLLGEIQSVYRAQNVGIDDKHIEVIIRQMLRKVDVTDPGDLPQYLAGTIADKVRLREDNLKAMSEGKQACNLRSEADGYYPRGLAIGKLHLGCIVPGNHQGSGRCCPGRQARRIARPQGKRYPWSLSSMRHRIHRISPWSYKQTRGAYCAAGRPRYEPRPFGGGP